MKKEVDQATDFVKQIEQGNLEVRYNGDDRIDENNLLASSLISMRNQMKQFAIDEKQRNWTTEGLASFVDILRSKNDDLQALSDTIVSNLVRYMGANQGALYILNDDDPQNMFLEMAACYAYERKKFNDRRIALGEGMTGQVVLEKQTLYRSDIPRDFVKITSGLGAALPRHLIIVPLMLDQKVYGVVEIASFGAHKALPDRVCGKAGRKHSSHHLVGKRRRAVRASCSKKHSSRPSKCARRKKRCVRIWKSLPPRRRRCSVF